MLSRTAARLRGISLIELMVALILAGILMALAAPSFSAWMQNTRIRSTAESIQTGIQFAKSEATSRNTRVRFQLTTSVDSSCALSSSGTSWVVDVVDADDGSDSVAGQCNAAPSDTVAPSILVTRAASDGQGTTLVQSSVDSLVFNGLGRLVPTPANNITILVSNTGAGGCIDAGGDLTCLRVIISPAGQVRMCNPRFSQPDPQAC